MDNYTLFSSYSGGGLRWFVVISLHRLCLGSGYSTLPIVPNSGGDLRWFAVMCGGLWWFAVVCGDLRWFAVVCLLVIPAVYPSFSCSGNYVCTTRIIAQTKILTLFMLSLLPGWKNFLVM